MNTIEFKKYFFITLITIWLMTSLGLPLLVLRYIDFLGYCADLAVKKGNKKYKIIPYLYKVSTNKVVEPVTVFEQILLQDEISWTIILGPLSIPFSIYYFCMVTVVFIFHTYLK